MNNIEFLRQARLALVTVLVTSRVFVESQNQFTIIGDGDKVMDNKYVLKTLVMTGKTIDYCLEQCLQDCRCDSFQICHMIKECQLCSSNKFKHPSALQDKKGCTNFVFEQRSMENNQQCDAGGCTTLVNCCMTSNPCLNGGTCLPLYVTRNNIRYKCKCPDGYTGPWCNQLLIQSCRGYSGGNRVAGKYKVFNKEKDMPPYEVYCDFDTDSSMTWTLIASYQRDHNGKGLNHDEPLNETDHAWNGYRLSKSRMFVIKKDSTKWRVTCQYQKQGCSADLVRGFNAKVNILKYMDGCYEVEYIRGHGDTCSNCAVYILQNGDHLLDFTTFNKECDFQPFMEQVCTDYSGDHDCCCSESATATTQVWFGGY